MLSTLKGFFVLLVTLVLCGSAAAEWTCVTSEHFSVAGDAPTAELRLLATRLELSRAVISRTLPGLKLDRGHALQVIVFADAAEYRGFKPKRADGTPDDAVAGYYLQGETRDLITLAADANDAATVTHEYVHYMLPSNVTAPAKLPPWLDEGLAQYFQSFRMNDDGTVEIGLEPLNRMGAIRKGGFTVPERLFADETPARGTDEQRASFYSWAWAAVHFVLTAAERSDKAVSLLPKAGAVHEAIAPLALTDITSDPVFISRLQKYVSSGVLPSRRLDVGRIDAAPEPIAATLSLARSEMIMGELLMKLGRYVEAEAHLRRATTSDGSLAEAHSLLGIDLARRGSYEDASKELEFAIAHGCSDPLTQFFRAYALTRAGSKISELDEPTLVSARTSLERSVAEAPEMPESQQLLAEIYLAADTNLPEAADLLKRAVSLKPGDESLQLLLARALLRQEKFGESTSLAKKLTNSADPRIRTEATELVDAAAEYRAAPSIVVVQPQKAMPWDQPYVFLKRSWLAPDDLSRIDAQLRNHNTNFLLGAMRTGEQRVLGTISTIRCSDGIKYDAIVNGKPMTLTSASFDGVLLSVLIEGSRSFKLDCGADLSATLAVLTYIPAKTAGSKPRLTAISFVGKDFQLQTPLQVWGYRTVIVEDDRLRRGPGDQIIHPADLRTTERWAAIEKELSRPAPGETRRFAKITRVTCGEGSVGLTAVVAGNVLDLSSHDPLHVRVRWFTTENTDASLACGLDVSVQNVLVTYTPSGPTDGELKAVEFLPSGFPFPDATAHLPSE
jgi:tetratricopeptide (TPR) repeat protein